MSESQTYALQKGIQLAIHGKPGKELIPLTAQFLADALKYFKDLRKTESHYTDGSFHRRYRVGRGSCVLELSGTATAIEDWVSAVIDGYTKADTLEQLIEDKEVFRGQATGWVAKVIAALNRRNGEPEALRLMFAHNPSTDM